MSDFVELRWKRNRGWPWPEASWGLTPMFGEDGWCHSCGVPRHPQCGSLVLERKGFTKGVEGAWIPNWQFDVICLERKLAATAADRFDIELRDIDWHGTSPGDAAQIVIPTIGDAWFDPDDLRAAAVAQHGTDGTRCAECGVWRWMPLAFGYLPPLRIIPALGDVDVVASPEWFGDGWKAFRQILVRRPLAEMIVAASPRDFRVNEVS
ncbi:MAG: hypothetical protein KDB26_11155 [Microthrixaceae bacterium]|nr:hypothetical protein [Microthrixaceae bacterium]